jgi:hypothetical protein
MPFFGRWRDVLVLACLGSAAGIMGCGPPPTGGVSGKITIKGDSPNMKGLQISFIAPNGRIVGAPINEDGTYQVTDVPVGEAKIGFLYSPPEPESKVKSRFPGKGATKPQAQEEAPNPIPESLRDGSTSNLTVQVVAGQNQAFDYDVK